MTRPGWSVGDSEHGGQSLDAAGHPDVSVRPRSSSCSQAQKHGHARLGAALTGDRPADTLTAHRREGVQQSSCSKSESSDTFGQ